MKNIKNNIFVLYILVILSCFSIALGTTIGIQLSKKFLNNKNEKNEKDEENKEINFSMAEAIEKVKLSVVNIKIIDDIKKKEVNNNNKAGSGIIFDEDDTNIYIATNEHIIKGAKYVKVSFQNNNYIKSNVIACDKKFDLAVLCLPKKLCSNIENIKIGKFCSKDNTKVGDFVITVGNVLGQGYTSTFGIISAKDRKISIEDNIIEVIQTDAAINPGSSGGPLVNLKGEIIGINTLKISKSNIEGIGYTISTDIFLPKLKEMKNENKK